jgi:hypothetical protein
MPADAVYVGRPTAFGNPFTSGTRRQLVEDFLFWLQTAPGVDPHDHEFRAPGFETSDESRNARDRLLARLPELRGRDLACWCPLDGKPCHADVLLDLANRPTGTPSEA